MYNFTVLFRIILPGIIFYVIAMHCLAQRQPYTFSKIRQEDFKDRVYDKDTSAAAVILGDKGESFFEYNEDKGFQLIFTRHLRIKIFTKNGYEFATHSIPIYRKNDLTETLVQLKGYTFNLVNGKVETTKLGSDNIFEEQINLNWLRTRFTMPDVKEGSIIDIQYKILSDYLWNVREWEFQSTIPTQWSEYTVTVPEYYVFSKLTHGEVPFVISETSSSPGTINFVSKDRGESSGLKPGSYAHKTTYERSQLDFVQSISHFAVCNVPAIKEEPYAPAMTNFISKIEFELEHSQFPGQPRKVYTSTWEDICELLLDDNDFGQQLQRGRIVKDVSEVINEIDTTPLKRIYAAHAFIRNRMTWNGKNGLYPTTNLRNAFDERKGNDADINLLLVVLLKELGLDASPVALSTRDNGILLDSHPVITQLNYVLASVSTGDKIWLLDATGKHRPADYLPIQCLNGNGLLISRTNMKWIPLVGKETENTLYHSEMKISGEGVVSGVLKVSSSGYSAERIRKDYYRDLPEKYYTSLKEKHKDWQIDEIKIENIDSLDISVNQCYKLVSEDVSQVNGNMIYFNALLGFGQNNNPFKAEKRESVVDFIMPLKETYVFSIEIPDGYVVESVPEPVKILLPDRAGSFRFIVSHSGNKVSVNSVLNISKVMYTATEYADLRQFFSLMVAKHSQQIILKKV